MSENDSVITNQVDLFSIYMPYLVPLLVVLVGGIFAMRQARISSVLNSKLQANDNLRKILSAFLVRSHKIIISYSNREYELRQIRASYLSKKIHKNEYEVMYNEVVNMSYDKIFILTNEIDEIGHEIRLYINPNKNENDRLIDVELKAMSVVVNSPVKKFTKLHLKDLEKEKEVVEKIIDEQHEIKERLINAFVEKFEKETPRINKRKLFGVKY